MKSCEQVGPVLIKGLLDDLNACIRKTSMEHLLSDKTPTRYFHDNPSLWILKEGLPSLEVEYADEECFETVGAPWTNDQSFPGYLLVCTHLLIQLANPHKTGLCLNGMPRVYSFTHGTRGKPCRAVVSFVPCLRSQFGDEFLKLDRDFHVIDRVVRLILNNHENSDPFNDFYAIAFLSGRCSQ